jgi:drug/metabolite transporter (DMT)-like permease
MHAERRNANLMLLLAAAIWGFAFVAQRVGMQHVGPLTFNGVRFAIGALVLAPLLRVPALAGRRADAPPLRETVRAGVIVGLVLFGGATLQQYGVVYTTAGKAGFITSLYVVFTPLLGMFVGQRSGRHVWGGVALAAAGLYLLSAKGLVGIALGDGLVLLGAVCWGAHVLVVGHYVQRVPALALAVGQFAVMAALSLAGAFLFEEPRLQPLQAATVPILYTGLLSVSVAYTLQVVAQRRAKPAHTAIILSLEAVFAVIGGVLILGETLGVRESAGCLLMLGGVILAQFDEPEPAPAAA